MKRRLLLVVALAAPLFAWRLGRPGFSDTEGMYAEPAREMVLTGDWVTPRMNGEPFLTKPPLAYWLAASVMALAGPTELARVGPTLAALGTVLVTGALGMDLFGEGAGLAAAAVLATTAGFLLEARLLRADMLLVLAVSTTLWCYVRLRRGGGRRRRSACGRRSRSACSTRGSWPSCCRARRSASPSWSAGSSGRGQSAPGCGRSACRSASSSSQRWRSPGTSPRRCGIRASPGTTS